MNPVAVEVLVDGYDGLAHDLAEFRARLSNPTSLNHAIGEVLITGGINADGRQVRGFQDHILDASQSRHTVARDLGAQPTGYLAKAAGSLEVRADATWAVLVITESAEIFSRALGEVDVHPRNRKWLAIPCDARTYGKSPQNFPDMLDFFEIIPGVLAAFRMRKEAKKTTQAKPQKPDKPKKPSEPGPTEKGMNDIVFWLRKSTRLTEDRGLLPSDDELYMLVELGLQQALELPDLVN